MMLLRLKSEIPLAITSNVTDPTLNVQSDRNGAPGSTGLQDQMVLKRGLQQVGGHGGI